MKITRILDWFARELEIAKFDDVSNNGLQIAGPSDVTKVAFAVDASLESVRAAAPQTPLVSGISMQAVLPMKGPSTSLSPWSR